MFGGSVAKGIVAIKRGSAIVQGVHQQHAHAEPLAQLQAAIHGMAEQQPSITAALAVTRDGQPADTHGGRRVAWQALAVRRLQVEQVQLRRRQAAVTKNTRDIGVINQDMRGRDAVALVLPGLFAQIGVQRWLAAGEAVAVVLSGIQQREMQRHVNGSAWLRPSSPSSIWRWV